MTISYIRFYHIFLHFHLKFTFFLDPASKPTESLEQIAAFNIEELLSKSAVLSEKMLQLQQSLTRDWGEGFVSTLPEDFVQNLLMEVRFLRDLLYPPFFFFSFRVICQNYTNHHNFVQVFSSLGFI